MIRVLLIRLRRDQGLKRNTAHVYYLYKGSFMLF